MFFDDGGDNCEAYEMPVLRFDLGPLRTAYEDSYATEEGAISISVEGESVVYEFHAPRTCEQIDAALDEMIVEA